METYSKETESYIRAKKRVDRIKAFYSHLTIYIIANMAILLIKVYFFALLESKGFSNPDFGNWLEWNIISTPMIWGVFLLFHAFKVFKGSSFIKKWEERQIKRLMEKEGRDNNILY